MRACRRGTGGKVLLLGAGAAISWNTVAGIARGGRSRGYRCLAGLSGIQPSNVSARNGRGGTANRFFRCVTARKSFGGRATRRPWTVVYSTVWRPAARPFRVVISRGGFRVGAARRRTGPEAGGGDGIVHPRAVRRRAARRFRGVIAWGVGRSAAAAGGTAGAFRVVWGAVHYGAVRVVAARRRVGPEAAGARGIVRPWAVPRRAARRLCAVITREVGGPAAAAGGAGASRILRAAAAGPFRAVADRSGGGRGATRLRLTVAACAMPGRRAVRPSPPVIARGGVGAVVPSRWLRRPAVRLRSAVAAWGPLRRPAA
jgi:hypothetical protein